MPSREFTNKKIEFYKKHKKLVDFVSKKKFHNYNIDIIWMVQIARKEIGYSPKTSGCDVFNGVVMLSRKE